MLAESYETERLTLAILRQRNVNQIADLVKKNIAHLSPWMPWAHPDVVAETDYEELVRIWDAKLESGTDHHYGIFLSASSELIGAMGVHQRVGPNALEIGYWIDQDSEANGYVTEAAAKITEECLKLVPKVVIKHEAENVKSRRIPEKLGYVEVGAGTCHDGRDSVDWVKERAERAPTS